MVTDDVSRLAPVDEAIRPSDAQPDRSRSTPGTPVRRASVAFAAAGLLVGTGTPSIVYGVHIRHEPLSFETWTFSYPLNAIGLVSVLLLYRELARTPVSAWPRPIWPLIGLVSWSLASVLWSVSPNATATRAMVAVGIAAFGVWFGRSLRFTEQLLAVAAMSLITTVGSTMLIAGWPNIGRNGLGDWQGVFGNPNSLGPANVIAMIAAVGVWIHFPRWPARVVAAGLGVVNLVMLTQTASITAQAGLAVCVLTAVAVLAARHLARVGVPGRRVAVAFGSVGVGVLILVIPNVSRIAGALGRDPTLASRTVIWSDMLRFIGDRPVQGYGYWAFWDNLDFAWVSYRDVGGYYGSAHNSFYEIALGLGLIGVALFSLVVLAAIGGVARGVWTDHSVAGMWWAVMLGFVLVEHLMESFVLWHSYIWMLLVAAAFLRRDGASIDRPSSTV
ncbi:MAG: O-antigen ligase family protein [Ilumatobacter sp.]|nr:O-antigen ligase family protein [Ilumatobacter sp.]